MIRRQWTNGDGNDGVHEGEESERTSRVHAMRLAGCVTGIVGLVTAMALCGRVHAYGFDLAPRHGQRRFYYFQSADLRL